MSFRFTEAFMESCIEESPSAFLGADLIPFLRQPTLGSFRPDLVFKEASGNVVLVEVQLRALDRLHLYKVLEYRHLLEERGHTVADIVLVCEQLDEKYAGIVKVYPVRVVVISREAFVEIAVRHCPKSIVGALSNRTEDPHLSEDPYSRVAKRKVPGRTAELMFRPIGWKPYYGPLRYLEHIYREEERLGISLDDLRPDKYWSMVNSVAQLVKSGIPQEISYIGRASKLNMGRLMSSGRFRKPKMRLVPHITTRGNLSVIWYPERGRWDSDESDWSSFSTERYGWERPSNEIFFLRDIGNLLPRVERGIYARGANFEVLDEILICLIRSAFDHLVECLRLVADVELDNDFRFELGGPVEVLEADITTGHEVLGWRIVSLDLEEREKDRAWLTNFEAEYGLSVSGFRDAYHAALSVPRRAAHNITRHVANDLKKRGLKLKPGSVEIVLEKMKKLEWGAIFDCEEKAALGAVSMDRDPESQ